MAGGGGAPPDHEPVQGKGPAAPEGEMDVDGQMDEMVAYAHTAMYGGDSPDGQTSPQVVQALQQNMQAAQNGIAEAVARTASDVIADGVMTAKTQGVKLSAEAVIGAAIVTVSEMTDVAKVELGEMTPDQELQALFAMPEILYEDTANSGLWEQAELQQAAAEMLADPEGVNSMLKDLDPDGSQTAALQQGLTESEGMDAGGTPAPAAPAPAPQPQMSARDQMMGQM